jgi:hypothetical protein
LDNLEPSMSLVAEGHARLKELIPEYQGLSSADAMRGGCALSKRAVDGDLMERALENRQLRFVQLREE